MRTVTLPADPRNCRHDWSYFPGGVGTMKRALSPGDERELPARMPRPVVRECLHASHAGGRRALTGSLPPVPGRLPAGRARRPRDRGHHQPARAPQRRRQRLRRPAAGGLRGLRRRRGALGGRAHRCRRDVLRRRRPEGGGRGGPPAHPRRRSRADGADPPDAGQARHRRRRGLRRGRRDRARPLVRPARGRRGRDLRGVLPALRRAAVRSRHGAAPPHRRARAGHGPDPHRTRRAGARGAHHGAGQPRRRARARRWRRPWRWPTNWPRCPRSACAPTA